MRRALGRSLALAAAAILATSVSWGGVQAQTADIAVAPGRLLGATRFQLAWLDWDAPRPVFLTALANPTVAHDVAALAGVSTALVSVSKPVTDGRNWGVDPSDILGVDLSSAEGQRVRPRPVLLRDPSESLSWPTWWPDGSAFVFQREDDAAAAVQSPDGFARPPARIEIAQADGSNRRVVSGSGWQPSPAPDGSAIAYVRFTDRGSSLLALGSDGAEHVLVDVGVFPEIFSPRYSPDGKTIAFGARSFADLMPMSSPPPTGGVDNLFAELLPRSASAHGTLADLWVVNADGSNVRQISSLRAHDPALAWAPDGSQLFAYGAWGGVLVDLRSGENTLMTYLTGTTAVAWLP